MDNTKLELELRAFKGPFDLLLHLIKEMKVDINDIPMKEITHQYLDYVHSMQELHLDTVGDYLVMAATLIEIKARLLLPVEPDLKLEGDYEPEDPRQVLVQQLLLYQQFQEAADHLEEKQEIRSRQFTRSPEDLSSLQAFIPLEEGALSIDDLQKAMYTVIQRELLRMPKEREIQHDPITVAEKIDQIMTYLRTLDIKERVDFSQFLAHQSKQELITSFMAMLELVRKQQICFFQSKALDKIEIQRIEEYR
ncbi:segregation and condensation protein A [Vaginisenegalia massiliensis]|uniref:segregation and condensation protein A n=1 Tax=Vaginisenegalia massiliensis TaxID=2058294 RepID=UPI000F53A907|nr:segregation/condensation protein A [Vaginisenegalia massiliensis]